MKRIFVNLIALAVLLVCCHKQDQAKTSKQDRPSGQNDTIPTPKGWKYIGGDEFNGAEPKSDHWGIYGAKEIGNSTYGQGHQQMIQTYKPEQVVMRTLPTGEKVCSIISVKEHGAPNPKGNVADKPGWWSGALSSRDVRKFYPLYCRMEIKAKVPNLVGVWHAFWCRYFEGAGVAELDMQEFFVSQSGTNVVRQSAHIFDYATHKTTVNFQSRSFPVADPSTTFHIYGVQVDPDPNHKEEAVISFLLDGEVTYHFSTASKPGHNRFIKDALKKGQLNDAWDVAITGQIGGAWVGFPADSVNKVVTDLDWFRCFIRK